MVELATADLAARLSIAATTINVKSVESVEWPDSSLGCPQPGQMYTQVITPGYRIILTAGGKDYDYHASRTKVVLCQS